MRYASIRAMSPLLVAAVTLLPAPRSLVADDVPSGKPEDFYALHARIKTQPDESRYRQIAWLTSVWAARQKAAAEGKPIFIWAGSGGGPVGVC